MFMQEVCMCVGGGGALFLNGTVSLMPFNFGQLMPPVV